MPEYIEREAAVNSISKLMPNLTTPDGTGQFDEEIFKAQELIVDCMETIHKIPTADVVEVVRCKDCENRYVPCRCALWYGTVNGTEYFIERGDDFSCSYGKRKEGAEK